MQCVSLLPSYAVFTRYPTPVRPLTLEEYDVAVEIAEAVVRWAEESL